MLGIVSLETFDCDLDRSRYEPVYCEIVLACKFVLNWAVITVVVVLICDPAAFVSVLSVSYAHACEKLTL